MLGVQLNKEEQTSNWIKRPLTESQLTYAAADVQYLLDLKHKILQEAADRGVLEWVEEENSAWDTIEVVKRNINGLVSKKDAERLSPYEIYVLNELYLFRDAYAREFNKPCHFIIPKDFLFEVVTDKTNKIISLKSRRDIHRAVQRSENEFWSCLSHAKEQAAAKGLSKTYGKFGPDVRQKIKAKEIIEEKYRPLCNEISSKYGNNTVSYIFPNGVLQKLALNEMDINDIPYLYRRNLLNSLLPRTTSVTEDTKLSNNATRSDQLLE